MDQHQQSTRQRRFLLTCLLFGYLIVGASSDGFFFTSVPNDQDVEEGQPFRLRCQVTPSKYIHYSWLRNGILVDTDQSDQRRSMEMGKDLIIAHADRDLDPGRYQCKAQNTTSSFTSTSREANVNIFWMEPDVRVHLVKPTKFTDIRFGKDVEFACLVHAHPPLTPTQIKWYHNGNTRLPNTEVKPNGNLRILQLGMQHAGSYHCRVIHAAGKLDSRPPFILQFDDKDPPGLITSLNREDFNKYVMRGESLELTCPQIGGDRTAQGMAPIIVWNYMLRLGERQSSLNNLIDVKLTETGSKVIIDKFDLHHANYYTCEIGWLGSQDKYVFLFQVELATLSKPKPTDFSPRLKLQPHVIRLRDTAVIRYYPDQTPTDSFMSETVNNPPPKIIWIKKGESKDIPNWSPHMNSNLLTYHPGSPVTLGPHMYALRGRHLIINEVTEADSGTYQMKLTNIAGQVSVDFDLLVTFPAEFRLPIEHTEHSYDEDDAVTLDCGIKRRSIDGSIVFWEKDQEIFQRDLNSLAVLEEDAEIIRFPKVKPVDQGQYQCFVQTEGYNDRTAGSEQTLVVKAKLQFEDQFEDYFLEVNSYGRLPCRVRGHGQLQVTWFRKVNSGLQTIAPPNQVEVGGTLVFENLRKTDAGDYVCLAKSSYKDSEINKTVRLIVGEKPQVVEISPNQTVRVGDQLVLSCHATGDPVPRIFWGRRGLGNNHWYMLQVGNQHNGKNFHKSNADLIRDYLRSVMNSNHQPPPGKQRIKIYPNGSLVIKPANLVDQTEYACFATNSHAASSREGLFVRVLSPDEYARWQLGEEGSGSSSRMVRTMLTVVGCAVAYLGLIIALTVFCSMRMVRKRRKQSNKARKPHENGQLLTPVGEPNSILNGVTALSNTSATSGPGNTMETGFLLTGMGSGTSGTSESTSYAMNNPRQPHLHSPLQPPQANNTILLGTVNGIHYEKPYSQQALHASVNGFTGSSRSPLAAASQLDSQEWWPWQNEASYFNPAEMQPKVPHGTPAGPLDGVSEPNTDSLAGYAQTLNSTPCHYAFYNSQADNSVNTTTTSEPQLVSAPPPTPLDSRSYFSGISSGNSTSLYSHSLLSGASNFNPASNAVNSANERMFYPRNELQRECNLGNGSFGEIFCARARQIRSEDNNSALILVKSLMSHEAAHINEFHRQVEMFGKVHHPNVTRLLAVCFDQEPFYMLLDYCDKGDLKTMLRRMRDHEHNSQKINPFTLRQKLSICRQVVMGMEHLAQLRCVHRDLAARNILLTSDMEIKVSHLGLCRDLHSADYYRLPNTDQYIPLRWFAPELIAEALPIHTPSPNSHQLDYGHSITGPSLPYTSRSDIWAYGVVVCEVFSFAMLPLNRLTDAEIVAAGRQTAQQGNESDNAGTLAFHPAPLRPDVPAELPNELNNLLLRCWSPVIRQRPDFKEITNLLNDLLS